jgi:hypothetical protein
MPLLNCLRSEGRLPAPPSSGTVPRRNPAPLSPGIWLPFGKCVHRRAASFPGTANFQ